MQYLCPRKLSYAVEQHTEFIWRSKTRFGHCQTGQNCVVRRSEKNSEQKSIKNSKDHSHWLLTIGDTRKIRPYGINMVTSPSKKKLKVVARQLRSRKVVPNPST